MRPAPCLLFLAGFFGWLATASAQADPAPAEPPAPVETPAPAEPAPAPVEPPAAFAETPADAGESSAGEEKLELQFSGRIQSDLRFRVAEKAIGTFYNRQALPSGVERNENILQMKLNANYGRISGVADVDFIWYGLPDAYAGLADLSSLMRVDPFALQVQALYVEATNVGVDGLDLRVGYQKVLWGKGDQFNPTNTLNPNDLEDVLLFGEQLSNMMVKLDYSVFSDYTLSGVLVPVFKNALLPRSAPLGLAATDRMPMLDDVLRWRLHLEQAYALQQGYATVVSRIDPVVPERSFGNMPFAFRLAGPVFEQDLAISYYRGFSDMPVPVHNHTVQALGEQCDPADPARCIDGLLGTETTLNFPRMQVLGINLAGEMNPLGWISEDISPIGYRIELAVIFPERVEIMLDNEEINLGIVQPAGEYDYNRGGARPAVLEDTPFLKWVVGLDYTFNEHVYANVQWVHGFVDEFGAGDFIKKGYTVSKGGLINQPASDTLGCVISSNGNGCAREILRPRLGDYLVLGVDLKFREERVLLRLFTIWPLNGVIDDHYDDAKGKRVQTKHTMFTPEGFSAVIYPEFNYNFRNGLELGLGALFMLGKDHTKFGDPSTGGTLVFGRAKYSF